MRGAVRKPLRLLVLVAGLSCAGFAAWAQAPQPPAARQATGAPLQLLAPLPSQVSPPATAKPTIAVQPLPAPMAQPPAVAVVPPPAPLPAVAPAPVAPAAPQLALPIPPAPAPVTSDLFAATPAKESKPPASVAVATPQPLPEVKPAPEKQAAPKPSAAPEPQKLTVIVAGDSIADGVWGGLYRKLLHDKRYEIVRKARNSSGFVAFDWVEELAGTEELKRADAVIFLAGTNDRQSLVRSGKPRYLFGTKEWEAGYVERVTSLMQALKARNIPLVWIGLPIARKDDFNKDSRYLNGLFAQAAAQAGVHFIDIWTMFADKEGQYSAYLPDADGRNRLLRDNDGIHFTPRGYEMIADTVLETLQKRVPVFQQAAMNETAKTGKQN